MSKIVLHGAGFQRLLKDPAILADLQDRAGRIARAAGDGFEATPAREASVRGKATVFTAGRAAKVAESEHGALTAAIDAGR